MPLRGRKNYPGDTQPDDGKRWVLIDPNRTRFIAQVDDHSDVSKKSFPCWGYPVHCSCWRVLEANCASYGTEVDVQALFDVCRSLPCRAERLNWGHDYLLNHRYHDDVSLFSGEEGPSLSISALDEYSKIPYDNARLGNFMTSGAAPTQSSRSPQTRFVPRHSDTFARLPVEMLCQILFWLGSRDVVRLREASPTFASLPLTDEFWSSRFWAGREFEWVAEAQMNRKSLRGKWYSLWRSLQSPHSLFRHGGRNNPKRIWELASIVRCHMQQRSEHSVCHGLKIYSEFEPFFDAPQCTPRSKDTWVTATCDVRRKDCEFRGGVRSLHTRRITLPASFQSISVSWHKMAGKTYISGFQILQLDNEILKFGYVNERQSTIVTWGEKSHAANGIHGFHVALEATGVRGLSIISPSGALSNWVGDIRWPPVRVLVLPTGDDAGKPRICAIEAEFDVSQP